MAMPTMKMKKGWIRSQDEQPTQVTWEKKPPRVSQKWLGIPASVRCLATLAAPNPADTRKIMTTPRNTSSDRTLLVVLAHIYHQLSRRVRNAAHRLRCAPFGSSTYCTYACAPKPLRALSLCTLAASRYETR